jgi:hypothetical protein
VSLSLYALGLQGTVSRACRRFSLAIYIHSGLDQKGWQFVNTYNVNFFLTEINSKDHKTQKTETAHNLT